MHGLARRSIVIALTTTLVASCSANGSTGVDRDAIPQPDPTTTTISSTSVGSTTSTTTSTSTSTSTSIVITTTEPASNSTSSTEPEDQPIELDPGVQVAVAVDAPCIPDWTPLTSTETTSIDEVTFARGGNIFTYQPSTGELRCLATIDREPRRLDWNPAGDRLLIDSDLILTESGVAPSGFAPDTPGITWSQPSGTALIAPSPDGSQLLHVNAARPNDVEDVASLAVTWAAAYHPSGLAIVSAGISRFGEAGIFIADNHGDDPRPLVILDDQSTTISELVFGHNGDWIAFVHDHSMASMTDDPVMGHVHRLFLPFLAIDDLGTYTNRIPTGLVTSEQVDGTVAWNVDVDTQHRQTTVMSQDAVATDLSVPELIGTPVGFLDAGTTVTLWRPAFEAPEADLWLYAADGAPTLVTRGVVAATTRTAHDPNWSEPPLDIEQRAVG